MKHHVIIVAGGSGTRMNSALPKQFMLLSGKPVLMHTMTQFYKAGPAFDLILVLPISHQNTWRDLIAEHQFDVPHSIVNGGETRFHSVKNGLDSIADAEDSIVAVHDGVRPLISTDLIARCFSVAEASGSAVPVIRLNDSVRQITPVGNAALGRENLRLVQTPQCFKTEQIKKAFSVDYSDEFTDCASVLEASGFKITLTEGESYNFKITTQKDLWLAEHLISVRSSNK